MLIEYNFLISSVVTEAPSLICRGQNKGKSARSTRREAFISCEGGSPPAVGGTTSGRDSCIARIDWTDGMGVWRAGDALLPTRAWWRHLLRIFSDSAHME
jgi:hypothetical protein